MGKSVVVVLLSMFIMVGGVSARTGSFSDMVQGDWFYDNVSHLVEEGIIAGYPDGSFKPNETMSIDAFIKTMVVALGEDPGNAEGYWAQNYIDAAMDMDILEEGDFDNYKEMITRSEMSLLAVRTVESLEGSKTYKYTIGNDNSLYESISDKGDFNNNLDTSYALYAYELGIITGYPDGSFKPNDGLKRSEAVTVIRRVIEESQRKPYEAPVPDEWDERAKEVYEETGIMPLARDGVVRTKEELQIRGQYRFDTSVYFRSDHSIVDDFGVSFRLLYARADENSKKAQLFEVEYILANVYGFDSTIVKELLVALEERVTSDEAFSTQYWDIGNGARLYIDGSAKDTKTVSIGTLGYEK